MRKAFTLIELLISITILSIMMLFLYKSYASLNHSNSFYKKEVQQIKDQQLLKKVLFLDFSLVLGQSATILNENTKEPNGLFNWSERFPGVKLDLCCSLSS